ncbi:MAG: porin [Opitutaceae bacterium]|nr:porin [Opitutaceae bacterium]
MNKLLKLSLAGLFLATSALQGQIEINENLSITGFLDMSAVETDSEPNNNSNSTFNLDQVEIDFLLNFDELSGQIDLNYLGGNDDKFDLEQAFMRYDLGDGSDVEAGKFLSYMGFETFEPTGLYQYSYAYDIRNAIPGHHNGVRYNYNDDFLSLGLGLLDSVYDPDGSIQDSGHGIEAKIAITPLEGWTIFLGFAKDSMEGASQDKDLINFWTSYETGNVTWALEFNKYDFGPTDVGSQFLVMANLGLTETAGITFRVSEDDQDFKGGDTATKFTVSPNLSINDNLGVLFELSQTDYGTEGTVTSAAFETIFTF